MANVKQLVKKVKENRKKASLGSVKATAKKAAEKFDIIIIGAGVSGLAAAMYAGRMNLKTLVIGSSPIGGVITTTNDVENYPGFKTISGIDLAEKIKEHALEYRIKLEEDTAVKV